MYSSKPKTVFAVQVWQLAKKGLGSEDIFVALRQYGVTLEYARKIVFSVERQRVRAREQAREKRARERRVA